MKVYGIINRGISHINVLKFSKMSDDYAGGGVSGVRPQKYNILDNERGALKNVEISLIGRIKNQIPEVLKLIASPKNKNKLYAYDRVFDSPKGILALKVDNPKFTAFSGTVKTYRGEEYLDFTLHGYFGDKKRFLINNNGEIIKSAPAKFFTNEKYSAMDKEPVYYTQHEINNMDLGRYLGIFGKEIKKLDDFIKLPIIPLKTATIENKPPFDSATFMFNQREAINKLQNNFDKLYYGITNNARTSIQRRKLSDICDVALHSKFPLMQINNFNTSGDSALVNFTEIGKKPVARIVVHDENGKTNRLFINGQLVEEWSRDGSNPFTVGRISKYYSPIETTELGVESLLKNLNDKLIFCIKQLRGVLGTYRVDK